MIMFLLLLAGASAGEQPPAEDFPLVVTASVVRARPIVRPADPGDDNDSTSVCNRTRFELDVTDILAGGDVLTAEERRGRIEVVWPGCTLSDPDVRSVLFPEYATLPLVGTEILVSLARWSSGELVPANEHYVNLGGTAVTSGGRTLVNLNGNVQVTPFDRAGNVVGMHAPETVERARRGVPLGWAELKSLVRSRAEAGAR